MFIDLPVPTSPTGSYPGGDDKGHEGGYEAGPGSDGSVPGSGSDSGKGDDYNNTPGSGGSVPGKGGAYDGNGSGSGSGSGSDHVPSTGSGSGSGSGSESAPGSSYTPVSQPGYNGGSNSTGGSKTDNTYPASSVVVAGASFGKEITSAGAVFAAFVAIVGLF